MASSLLYYCLWIAITFAAAPKDDVEKEPPGQTLSHRPTGGRDTVVPTLLENVDESVADYAEKKFLDTPLEITDFNSFFSWAISGTWLMLCGLNEKGESFTTVSHSLLGIGGVPQSKPSWDVKLEGFNAYPEGIQVFVGSDKVIILKKANGGKSLALSGQFPDNHHPITMFSKITMAPSVSRNGLLWIYDGHSTLVLINAARMLTTEMAKVISYRHAHEHGIYNTSLNPAGTLLAYAGNDRKVHVYSVVCDDENGEISLHACMTLTKPFF